MILRKTGCWSVLLCSLLASCANMPSVPEAIAKSRWTGKSMTEAIEKWGTPHQLQQVDQEHYLAIWNVDSFQNSVVQPTGQTLEMTAAGPTLVGHSRVQTYYHQCDLQLTFNQQLTITHFKTHESRNGSCSDFYWGKNRP